MAGIDDSFGPAQVHLRDKPRRPTAGEIRGERWERSGGLSEGSTGGGGGGGGSGGGGSAFRRIARRRRGLREGELLCVGLVPVAVLVVTVVFEMILRVRVVLVWL